MGSTKIAAVLSLTAFSKPVISLKSTCLNPSIKGPNPERIFFCPVAAIPPVVLP